MKLIYLIQAHKNPRQLNELIARIKHRQCEVFVHIDAKSDLDIDAIDSGARLIDNRISIQWGDISQVKATLNSIEEIERKVPDYDHLIFISGQDFPIKTHAGILASLEKNRDYLRWQEISETGWDAQYRFSAFRYQGNNPARKFLFRAFNKIYAECGIKRRIPYGLKAYGGSSWWILSKASVTLLLAYLKDHPGLLRFFRHTICPDEMFFQTILCNSSRKDFIVNDNLRFIRFLPGHSNPETLDESYYDAIVGSGCVFCRKIESPRSDELLRRLLRRHDASGLKSGATLAMPAHPVAVNLPRNPRHDLWPGA